MRILMISTHGYVAADPELGKPDTGGQVVYVLELANRFSRLGSTVDLVTRQFEDQPEEDVVNENFKVVRIPFGGKKFIRKEDMHDHLSKFVTNFLADARTKGKQYDIVYSHYWDAGFAGQKIAEELDIPHIHTPHSLGWWKKNNMGTSMKPEEMEKNYRFEERIKKEFFVFQMCNHVIATTEPQTELLIDKYDVLERRISVVPPGMDEGRFSPVRFEDLKSLRKKYSFKDHDVLVVGRMAKNKGHDLLFESFPTLKKLVPDARLFAAIGSDDSEQDKKGVDELKKLAAKLGIEEDVVWRPYIPDNELADHYRCGSVFSMSSRYEPFGMVAIEAMACGTPSVVTVHGGLKDVIDFGSQALFADPNRPIEYGTMLAIPMLYENVRKEISIEGARFARRVFGWTGIAKRILKIFESHIQVTTMNIHKNSRF
ncbi:MAG: glycosyltransferase family 1 protein [Cyclobacteriaceae bacterium]|nr:glycosyltransferase family 1 protein [Cyclobacteriaceae bacterium]